MRQKPGEQDTVYTDQGKQNHLLISGLEHVLQTIGQHPSLQRSLILAGAITVFNVPLHHSISLASG